ncbi:MAG: YceD family protein [Ignavibacteriales bacterium]
MEIEIIRLMSGLDEYIDIDEHYTFDESYLSKTDILKLDNVHVKGSITKDSLDNLILSLKIDGVMVLPCSVTLEPVDYPFTVEIEDNLEDLLEEIDENPQKLEKTIDILPIIWENVLMEMPMKVTSPKAKDMKLSGNGWELVTEEKTEVNPELQKLKDLL